MPAYFVKTTHKPVPQTENRAQFEPVRSAASLRAMEQMSSRTYAPPTVGISNRPGFGFDAKVFRDNLVGERYKTGAASLPPGFEPLSKEEAADKSRAEKEASDVRDKRNAAISRGKRDGDKANEMSASLQVGDDLERLDGLFIPGGQDREKDTSPEKTSRFAYEQALVKHAQTLGMPILAVCGGSRSFAMAFGAQEVKLSKAEQKIHKKTGPTEPAHAILLPNEHTFLGVATRALDGTDRGQLENAVNAVNSTHEKVLGMDKDRRLTGVPDLATGEPQLIVSALNPNEEHPEGFETPHGAPQVGVTSHPEAVFGSKSGRDPATEQFQNWSDNIFKQFHQSMQTYRARRDLADHFKKMTENAELDDTNLKVDEREFKARVALALGKSLRNSK